MSKSMLGLTKDFRGTLNDLLEKLGGENGEEWFVAFKRFLRKENPWVKGEFVTWKTVTISGLASMEQLIKGVRDRKFDISDVAASVLSACGLGYAGPISLELVRVRIRELGFSESSETWVVHQRASELGLKLCAPQLVLHLLLQNKDFPGDSRLHFPLESYIRYPENSHGDTSECIISIEKFEKRKNWHLGVNPHGGPCGFYTTNEELVFVRDK